MKRRSSKRTFCYPSKEFQLNRRISPVPSSLLPLWVHPLHPTTSSGSFLLTRGEIICANASTRYQHCEGTERRRNPTYLILVLRSIHTLSLNDTSFVSLLLSHTIRPGALMQCVLERFEIAKFDEFLSKQSVLSQTRLISLGCHDGESVKNGPC